MLVALHDGRPVPKVIDFGIAKATHQRLTERTLYTNYHQIIGTPQYMSPEQAEFSDLDIDTRSDIYSLGVLLYELLTSSTPFRPEDMHHMGYDEICHTIRHSDPPTPSRSLSALGNAVGEAAKNRQTDPAGLRKLLRGDLDWIVMKALEKDRTRRYETANALAADIDRFLREEAIEARPPSAGYKLHKFARRNKALLATLAAIAAVLLAASISSTSSAIRAVQAEKLATERLVEVEDQRNEAIWNQYVARQFPITDAWQRRDFGHLEQLLDELLPSKGQPDFRGWEWAYFKDQCDRAFIAVKGRFPAWHPQKNALAVVVTQAGLNSAIELRSPNDASLLRTISVIPTSTARQILGLRWSPDGARLAYSTSEGGAVVLDAATGDTVFSAQIYTGDNWKDREIHGFDLSRNGKLLALSNNNGRIEIWDVDTGKRVRVLHDPEQYSDLDCVAFSSTSDHLAAALKMGRRTTWNVETGESFEYAPQSNKNGFVAWNRSGTHFAATGGDSFAIFELNHANPQKTLSHRTIARVSWIGDDRLVSAGYDHVIRIWDAKSYALLSEQHLHRSPVEELTASFDEKFLAASAGDEVKVAVLDSNSRQAARLIPEVTLAGERQYLAWENQGRFVASGHLEIHGRNDFLTPLRIWDVNTGQLVGQQTIGVIRGLSCARINWPYG